MKTDLSDRQRQILDFIIAYIDRFGCSPTYERIAAELRLTWISQVTSTLAIMERKGWIERTGKPGGIIVKRYA